MTNILKFKFVYHFILIKNVIFFKRLKIKKMIENISKLLQIKIVCTSEHPFQNTAWSLILFESNFLHFNSFYSFVRLACLFCLTTFVCMDCYKSQFKGHFYFLDSTSGFSYVVLFIKGIHNYQLWLRRKLLN